MTRAFLTAALSLAAVFLYAGPAPATTGLAGLGVAINHERVDTRLTSAFVAPGQPIHVTLDAGAGPGVELEAAGLSVKRLDARHWQIAAPARAGGYPLVWHDDNGHARRINLFVMQAFDPRQDVIGDYNIGHYKPVPLRGRAVYKAPTALMPVTKAIADMHLSPHFTLGQFLCHQQPDHWPKYVLVRPRLVAKLEAILTALRARGIQADTLTVMSGYRTPAYNAAIGNTTVYSRHLYGGAADIFVDTNDDGLMDDLDGDGAIGPGDARWLAALIESIDATRPRFVGGLSAYPSTSAHGPFVHTDVRGVAARW